MTKAIGFINDHLQNLAKDPRLCMLTHPNCDLLIYVREDRIIQFEVRQLWEADKFRPLTIELYFSSLWNRVDR